MLNYLRSTISLVSNLKKYLEHLQDLGYRAMKLRISDQYLFGVIVILLYAVCDGFSPIFGKLAYRAQVTPFTLAAARTVIAAGCLWLFYLLVWRDLIRIGWRSFLGCIVMGATNGIGSLLFYSGLVYIDASLAQFLFCLYPIWVFIFLSAAGHEVSRATMIQLGLALVGIFLLTYVGANKEPIWLGIMLAIGGGACFGWHLVLGQWTLADLDSRTVALYVLTAMAATVVIARLLVNMPLEPISRDGWIAIILLALISTALSRLLMFSGLRLLGGVQTSIVSVATLGVTLVMAFLLLGERLTLVQWVGGFLVILNAVLIGRTGTLEVTWEELLRDGRWRELAEEQQEK